MEIAIFQIIVLIFSAIIHEYMHGWMAWQLGDSTAKDLGRLTLNPIAHIDPFGSVLIPAMLVLTQAGFVFGWAKPVPFNPYNLRDKKYGGAKVALAGPAVNFTTALFFGAIARLLPLAMDIKISIVGLFFRGGYAGILDIIGGSLIASIFLFIIIIVFINLLLMIFNLVPIPPLDGSKVIMPFLPYSAQLQFARMERYGMLLVLLFIMVGFRFIMPLIILLFRAIVGI